MRRYEHRYVPWRNLSAVQISDEIGDAWRYCGLDNDGDGVWAREIPAPEPAALLMEISQQLEGVASEVEMDTTMMRLSRLANCIAAIARGESVTIEDILGKATS